jgi:hypothetical protein
MGFSDLTSSSRGPGVIGTVLAMVVLIGFGCLYMFVYADAGQPNSKRLDVIVREQATELESSEFELANLKAQIEKSEKFKTQALEIDSLNRQAKTQSAHISELESNREAGEAALNKAKQAFEDYKNAYRKASRESAKGEKIPVLKTISGETYLDVVIRNVDEIGMDIRHSQGFKRIDYENLPENIQDRFQFDPEQKNVKIRDEITTVTTHTENAELVTLRDQYRGLISSINGLKAKNEELSAQNKEFISNDARYKSMIDQQRVLISAEEQRSGGIKKTPQMRVELTNMEAAYTERRRIKADNERQIRSNESTIADQKSKLSQLGLEIARKIDELKEKQKASESSQNQ